MTSRHEARSTMTAAPLYWGVASAETESAVAMRTSRGAKVFIVVKHYTLAICVGASRRMSLSDVEVDGVVSRPSAQVLLGPGGISG